MTRNNSSSQHSISSANIFADCSKKQRRRLDEISTPIHVKAGYELTQEHQTGREFGVLLDGTATVTVDGEVVATLTAGDHFGEVALFETIGDQGEHRTATVTADCDLWVAVMSMHEFKTLTVEFPAISIGLRQTAARRTAANAQMAAAG